MSRIMALDVGHRRIGVAVSDPARILAQPLCVLEWDEEGSETSLPGRCAVIGRIEQLCRDNDVDTLVVGLPRNMNATLGPQARYTLDFARQLRQRLDCRVVMMDERLTSQSATNLLIEGDISRRGRKGKVDKLAAALILRTYLDAQASTGADVEGNTDNSSDEP